MAQLATWPQRILPGIAALGGMLAPASSTSPSTSARRRRCAAGPYRRRPTSPSRSACCRCSARACPPSLKVFLTALAILDDLGAIIIIALFYPASCRPLMMGLDAVAFAASRSEPLRVGHLLPYLVLGVSPLVLRAQSGVHAYDRGCPAGARHSDVGPRGDGKPSSPLPPARARAPSLGRSMASCRSSASPMPACPSAACPPPPSFIRSRSASRWRLFFGKQIGVFGSVWLAARARPCPIAAQASTLSDLRHGAPLRHRLHHEPVHRPARLRRLASVRGQDQAGSAGGLPRLRAPRLAGSPARFAAAARSAPVARPHSAGPVAVRVPARATRAGREFALQSTRSGF